MYDPHTTGKSAQTADAFPTDVYGRTSYHLPHLNVGKTRGVMAGAALQAIGPTMDIVIAMA